MLTFGEARARLLAGVTNLASERVALDRAGGRVLAEDVLADVPLPRFDFSAMDGYAVAFGEAVLEYACVAGESRTGGPAPEPLAPGTACRIFTGAPVPEGCDAVVPHEDATFAASAVVLTRAARPGQHIRRRGEDIAPGATALARGTRLLAPHVGLLAALDRASVPVAARPRVIILTTGDELRAAGETARQGSIPDANGPMLAALTIACGGVATTRRAVDDDLEATRRVLRAALAEADVLVTAGGVGGSARDVVRDALQAEGIVLDVVKVAMKPGKPLVLGHHGAVHVLALPGNPAAAFVTFASFGAPLLRALQGDARPFPAPAFARLAHDTRCSPGKMELARANLFVDGERLTATLLANQSAGALTSLAWADALAMLPGDHDTLAAGALVEVLRLTEL